jgi:1,6-anhydro-N-acetylmuramate kinase
MSGTSADGIDAALVKIQHQQIELLEFTTILTSKRSQATAC